MAGNTGWWAQGWWESNWWIDSPGQWWPGSGVVLIAYSDGKVIVGIGFLVAGQLPGFIIGV